MLTDILVTLIAANVAWWVLCQLFGDPTDTFNV